MDEYERLKKKRSLYRRSATNLEKRVNEALDGDEEANTKVLKKYVAELKEVQGTLSKLDEDILEFVITEEDEVCEKEIDDAAEYKDKVVGAIVAIEEELEAILEMGSNCSRRSMKSCESLESVKSERSSSSQLKGRRVRVELPQLELGKFSGEMHEWAEFWDSFRSAVHDNDHLDSVD